MIDEIWTTRDMRLFVRQGERVDYVPAEIGSINFYCYAARWVCPYCTVENTTAKCSGCQAPKPSGIHMGEATVTGALPQAVILDSLENGYTLEVLRKIGCHPAEYIPEDIVLKVESCRTVQKCIPELTFRWPDNNTVELTIVVSGKVVLVHDSHR